MIPKQFNYVAPQTLDEAVELLNNNAGSLPLAGGHSLLPEMKRRRVEPTLLVDLRKISELQGVRHRDGKGGFSIGAMTTFAALAADRNIQEHYLALAEALRILGDPQLRNRGTIGGNLAAADPTADLPAVMLAFDATINLVDSTGPRAIPVNEYLSRPGSRAARTDEILTSIDLPAASAATGSAYEKLKHNASYAAISGVAVRIVRASDGTASQCRVAVTGATEYPVRLTAVEAALENRRATAEHIADAASLASQGASFRSDLIGSAEYRAHLTRVLAERALKRAVEQAGLH